MKKYSHKTKKIGTVIFGMDENLLSSVAIYQDANEVKEEVSKKIPDALKPFVAQLDKYLEGNSKLVYQNALKQEGTEFQKLVWKEISKIPYGKTKSYQEIAKAIKRPKAVRAVGTACGANKLALIIPCHRVVSSTGRISGFRWGSEIKEKLLELEMQ